MDTGSNKNYIQPRHIRNHIPNNRAFYANSVGGSIEITHHAFVNLFGPDATKIQFFILPSLISFDGIIGNDTLKQMKAIIHTDENYMTLHPNLHIPLKQHISETVNSINIRTTHLSQEQSSRLKLILKNCSKLLTEPDEKLTYTSTVKGEIRTKTDDPVYSRSYPYPMALKGEVEKEVNKLLKDGIIRPSKSAYNSPVWIVPKKQDASGEKKYRMVIDYRKLNTVTIPERYPIPEISEILANLGKNKFFSIIDLKSGFHQIPLKERDIPKTAFSINNGKFEFTRLPFGLKNAPSIFQRTLDDILREHIGVCCYVYIDDIIIFGRNEEEHFSNLEKVLKTLEASNMKIQSDKCEFMKTDIEFLGFVVSKDGIKTNPQKVQAIANMAVPKTLKDLRSFLGMSGYYRRFIQDYAKIAKPLTSLLRGVDGRVSKNQSKNKIVHLDSKALNAFNNLKNCLVSKEVVLTHPNFEKEFHLTTDASDYAIGAVLSQDKKPIVFLSRTLTNTEENYATNEKEMLAIIWALTSLRSYLYGSRKIKIYTDHQPLTYALSNKNTNSKMKRWKAILEEYNYELEYKPGRANVVADSLSRPPKSTLINSLTPTEHSDESSSHNLIPTVESPINAFRNQIILKFGNEDSYQLQNPFPNYSRHIFIKAQYSNNELISIFKRYLNPNTINGLLTAEENMGRIQEIYPEHFSSYRIRYTQKFVEDVSNEAEQEERILQVHKRAHRNAEENRLQLLEHFYFPRMSAKIKSIVKRCCTCKVNKYDRHPNKPLLNATPIPAYAGHTIHIDLFSTEGHRVLTAVDKFSKFAQAKIIASKSIEDIKQPLTDLLFFYCVPEIVVIDNEGALRSASITSLLEDDLKIRIYKTPPYKSEINGQVERWHSTLTEIMRCLKEEGPPRSFENLLQRAVYEYNLTIHSTTGKKPVELHFGRTPRIDPDELERIRLSNIEKLRQKQQTDIKNHNKTRQPTKQYETGETIYVKQNKRKGSKLTARYKQEIVKENNNTTVLTESGKIIHKSHIRN